MKYRRRAGDDGLVLEVDRGRHWEIADPAATPTWLQAGAPETAIDGRALPFQPRSFRDCALFERHWIQSSRGYTRRFLPAVHGLSRVYEALLQRPFPAFKPRPIAYRQPVYYFGNHLSFVPSGTPVRAPAYSQALDYELELGLILAQPLLNATPETALDAIGGFVVVNDWSARDRQREEMLTGLGPQKCKHFLSSMSDTLVTAEDILPQIDRLETTIEINGALIARSSTRDMLFSLGEVLAHLSKDEPLFPGELIATGTVPNGCAMENGRWVQPGDRLRLVIEHVGEIVHELA